jgi:hypothetical protein
MYLGEAMACHHIGEFLSLVRDDRKRAAAGTYMYIYMHVWKDVEVYL